MQVIYGWPATLQSRLSESILPLECNQAECNNERKIERSWLNYADPITALPSSISVISHVTICEFVATGVLFRTHFIYGVVKARHLFTSLSACSPCEQFVSTRINIIVMCHFGQWCRLVCIDFSLCSQIFHSIVLFAGRLHWFLSVFYHVIFQVVYMCKTQIQHVCNQPCILKRICHKGTLAHFLCVYKFEVNFKPI